jgi:glucan phosphoethanolaminetransferase (alkaline phosphatase superfamily)
MFTRINFLLGFGVLVAIGFYFAGNYLVVLPLSIIAPNWVKPIAGVTVLISLALTVHILSSVMNGMMGVASYTDSDRAGAFALTSQVAIVCGHASLAYLAMAYFSREKQVTELQLLVVAALYAAGIAIAIQEWRRRKAEARRSQATE